MPVLAGQASPIRSPVLLTLMVTVIQRLYGLGGAMDLGKALAVGLVVDLVVAGEDGELMDTLAGKF